MTSSTTEPPTGFRHPYMTPKQAKWVFDLINTRIGQTGEAFAEWKARYFAIDNRASFENAITELRTLPLLVDVLPEAASEIGTYLDPDTLKLYRVRATKSWDLYVLAYSQPAQVRRLLSTGEVVKVDRGKWTRWNAFDSRRVLHPRADRWYLKAEWFMTDTELTEYVTGECNFCHRGLKDGRSVIRNYGPDCAIQRGLPWGD